MKSLVRLIGTVLVISGIVLLVIAGLTFSKVKEVAGLPANLPGANPAEVGQPAGTAVPGHSPTTLPDLDQRTPEPVASPATLPLLSGEKATPPVQSQPATSSPTSLSPNAIAPGPSATPTVKPAVEMYIRGSVVKKDMAVKQAGWTNVTINGQLASEWQIPFDAAGHHINTPNPGETGNAVFSGHHNLTGPDQFGVGLFAYNWNLTGKDKLYFSDEDGITFEYSVTQSYPVLEEGQPEAVREEHARQILGPSAEPIVTLITCWAGPENPFASNTYRWIVVGKLVSKTDVAHIPSLDGKVH